jgi:hypothetical protein
VFGKKSLDRRRGEADTPGMPTSDGTKAGRPDPPASEDHSEQLMLWVIGLVVFAVVGARAGFLTGLLLGAGGSALIWAIVRSNE